MALYPLKGSLKGPLHLCSNRAQGPPSSWSQMLGLRRLQEPRHQVPYYQNSSVVMYLFMFQFIFIFVFMCVFIFAFCTCIYIYMYTFIFLHLYFYSYMSPKAREQSPHVCRGVCVAARTYRVRTVHTLGTGHVVRSPWLGRTPTTIFFPARCRARMEHTQQMVPHNWICHPQHVPLLWTLTPESSYTHNMRNTSPGPIPSKLLPNNEEVKFPD